MGVLRHRHFRNVWLGSLTSSIGAWMESIGMNWLMAQMTLEDSWRAAGHPSASLMLSYLTMAQLLPTVPFGLAGGLLADRVNRKRLLLATQLALMMIAGFMAFSSWHGWITPWFLVGVALINGIALAVNVPAWQTLTPRLVPRAELTAGITLMGIQFNLARVVGPGLGGLLMGWSGPTVLFVINTLSFLGVMFAVAGTPDAPAPPRSNASAWAQVREAVVFVFRNKGPSRAFIALVLFSVLGTPLMRMLPLLVAEVYHAKEETFGTLLALMGLGAVLGGLCLKFFPKWYPKHHLIPLSMMLAGITEALLASATTVLGAGIAIFFAGAFWLWSFNSAMSAMQLLVDDRMRGRVLAVCNTAIFGAMPLGAFISAYISHVVAVKPDGSETGIGAQLGVGLLAVVLAVAGLVMLIWRTPEVDGLRPGDHGYDTRPGLIRGVLATGHRPVENTAKTMDNGNGKG